MKQRKIDLEKLTTELNKRGLNLRTASREMGHAERYLSQTKQNGINEQSVQFLHKVYGISPESYLVDEPKPEPKSEPKEGFNDYKDELYNLIYSAVYEATKKALEG